MKKLTLLLLSLVLLSPLSNINLFASTPPQGDGEPSFTLGVDMGWLTQYESQGWKCYDKNGNERECMSLMADYGITAERIRVWVDPSKHDNWCGKEDVLVKCQRAKALGQDIMIDFHYSDWWADPAKQNIPASWRGHSFKKMQKDLANHTIEVLSLLKSNGINVKWVQIGNETSHGMLWSVKMDPKTGWEYKDENGNTVITESMGHLDRNPEQYAGFIRAGYDAVKTIYPQAICIVHLDNGFDNNLYNRNLDTILKYGGKFDMIGMSIYPYWSIHAKREPNAEKTITDCITNINLVAEKYGVDVMITETGFEVDEKRPAIMEEGREQLRRLIYECKNKTNGHCKGVFYWEPECRPGQYKLGAFTSDGRPTTIMDGFLEGNYNAQFWLDNNRKHINAHGGNIIRYGNKYYWYGENRPDRGFTTEKGIGVYSSTDLKNWIDEGIALTTSPNPSEGGEHQSGSLQKDSNPDGITPPSEGQGEVQPGCIMERPKVIYNAKTKKFVMLFHLELKGRGYEAARVAFAQSDSPTGPFQYIRSTRINAGIWPFDMSKQQIAEAKKTDASAWKDWWTPEWRKETKKGMYLWRDMEGGQMSRDMTVFIDDDGKAYHITSSQENLTLLISELTDDYLGYTGKYTMVAPGGQNEAPTILKRDGKYWLICSGCTGWDPNEARMFSADNIFGPWTQHPSPFHGKPASYRGFQANKTFGAQGTYILEREKLTPQGASPLTTDYVFMADIWNPRHLSQSLHIWLPIHFTPDGTPTIEWTDEIPVK